jgi:hypothetical protein
MGGNVKMYEEVEMDLQLTFFSLRPLHGFGLALGRSIEPKSRL